MENSTHHKTPGVTTFAECGPDATPLLRVNPGIDVRHALEHSANLQHIASQLMADSAMGDGGQHLPWAAVYLNEMAQAIVEDLALVQQE